MLSVGYYCVAIAGYAMLGNQVTGNILQSIPYEIPAFIANIGVLLHVAAAYQVFSMNVYQVIEEKLAEVSFNAAGGRQARGGRAGGWQAGGREPPHVHCRPGVFANACA